MLDSKRELTADAVSVRNTNTVASIRIRLLYNFKIIYNGIRLPQIWVIFEHTQTVDTRLSFPRPFHKEKERLGTRLQIQAGRRRQGRNYPPPSLFSAWPYVALRVLWKRCSKSRIIHVPHVLPVLEISPPRGYMRAHGSDVLRNSRARPRRVYAD